MRRELYFLAIGGVLGAAAVLSIQGFSSFDREGSTTSPALVRSHEPQRPGVESGSHEVGGQRDSSSQLADFEQYEDQVQQDSFANSSVSKERGQTLSLSEVPEPYDKMLKPRQLPKNLKTPELYERFKSDVRDNSWADAMELGINQYIAERGSDLELVFDFVECRSRYCVVAGVSYSQDRGPWNTFNPEMTNSGWWLASGGNSTVGGTYGNETRFATIISRELSDTTRPSSSEDSGNRSENSDTQMVQAEMASR